MVVRREERLGPLVSHFDIFGRMFGGLLVFSDPKRPIMPGLSGFIPNVLSISSRVGDYKLM